MLYIPLRIVAISAFCAGVCTRIVHYRAENMYIPPMYRTCRVCTVHTAYVYPKRIMGEEDAAVHRDRRPPTGVAEIFEKIRIFV